MVWTSASVGSWRGADPGVGDDAETARRDREEGEHPVLVPEQRNLRRRDVSRCDMDVGEDEVRAERIALERRAEGVTDDGMRAVAADQPARFDGFGAPVGMTNRACDAVPGVGETDELDVALDPPAQRIQALLEEPLAFRLRDEQDISERRRQEVERYPGDHIVTGPDDRAARLQPGCGEGLRRAGSVEQFEAPRPDRERLRLVGPRRGLVDDPHRNPIAGKLQRHRQADRPRAHHKNRFRQTILQVSHDRMPGKI